MPFEETEIDTSNVLYDIPDDEGTPEPSRSELVAELRTKPEKPEKGNLPDRPVKDPVDELPAGDDDPLEQDSPDVLPSEQDDPDAARTADGEPGKDEPANADNSAAGPKDDDGQPPILGKFKRQEDLITAYNHLERRQSELSAELKQARWQAEQSREALAKQQQQQAASSLPPTLKDLPADQREQLVSYCEQNDLNPNQVLLNAWQIRQAQSQADDQVRALRTEQRKREWDQAAQGVQEYAGRLDSYGEQAVSEFESYPEVFSVLRELEPEAVSRFGRHYVDLIESKQKLAQLQSEVEQREKQAYRRGFKAAEDSRDQKATAGTSASRARNVATPSRSSAKSQPATTLNRLLENRQRQRALADSDD